MGQIPDNMLSALHNTVPSCHPFNMDHGFEMHLFERGISNAKSTVLHFGAGKAMEWPDGRPLISDRGYDRYVRQTIESGICWRRIPKRQSVRLGVSRG